MKGNVRNIEVLWYGIKYFKIWIMFKQLKENTYLQT